MAQMIEVHIFERANLSGFGTWRLSAKKDLNQQNRYFFIIVDLGRPRNQNLVYGKNFI